MKFVLALSSKHALNDSFSQAQPLATANVKTFFRGLYIWVVRTILGRPSDFEIVMELTRVIEEDD
jgi:hypothetical protein